MRSSPDLAPCREEDSVNVLLGGIRFTLGPRSGITSQLTTEEGHTRQELWQQLSNTLGESPMGGDSIAQSH